MSCRKLATRTEFFKFKAVWIVAAIFLGDVITLFALDAGHGDFWADIRTLACHRRAPLFNEPSGRRLLEPARSRKLGPIESGTSSGGRI
jgi:hypothetical protein